MHIVDQLFMYVVTLGIGIIAGIFLLIWMDRCNHEFTPVEKLLKPKSTVYVSRCTKCCKIKTKEVK